MKRFLMLFSLLLLTGSLVMAQTVQISGTVTSSEDGLPVPGVSVIAKGTTVGAITGVDGKYILAAPQNTQTLVYSFVGFRTQEVPISGKTSIDVVLETDLFKVDEVVVVAYGTQQKRDITGSISSVKGDAIRAVPVQSFDQALAGKAAGVSITMPNGVLNNPPVIRVRGFNSITSSSNPLIVVDGMPIFTGNIGGTAIQNSLADINPNDIESMEILKDASATALYGSRAANGVIIITTKKGSGAKTKVTYDGYVGYTEPFRLFEMMNAEQYLEHKNLAIANVSGTPLIRANDADGNPIETNWADYIYRKGFQQNHAITLSGSSSSTSYYLSVGYSNQEGMIKNNFYTRKNARMNIDHKVNKFLTMGANVAYTNGYTESPNTGSNFSTAGAARLAFVLPPIIGPFKNDGTYNITNGAIGTLGTGLPTSGLGYYNPAQIFDTDMHTTTSDRILATLYGSVEPVKGLVLKTVYGIDNLARETTTYWSPIGGDGYNYKGYAYNYSGQDNRWTWTNTANYNLTVAEKFNIGLLAGTEQQRTVGSSWNADKQLVSDPFFTTFAGSWAANSAIPGGSYGTNFYSSLFGRANVNWDKKYYFEASLRRDGYSGLSKNNKYGNFGGVSFMWNVSNEGFIANSGLNDIFSDIRLKASYGRVGNMFGIGNYSSLFLYGGGLYGNASSFAFSQAGNPNLKWETSDKYDLGLSFGIFKDRLQAEFSYFYNDVNNLILNLPQSPSKGIPGNSIPFNVGSMYNRGLEFSLTSFNISKPNLSWTTNFNFTYLTNEVTELDTEVTEIRSTTGDLETTNITVVGKPVGNLLAVETRGVDPTTGRRIFVNKAGQEILYSHEASAANRWTYRADGTVAPAINTANDGVAWASPLPKYYGGIDNTLAYKGIDFSVNMTYALGFYVYCGSKAGIRDQRWWNNSKEVYETAWKNPGDVTNIPKPIWNDNVSNGSSFPITENVEKGDYLKIRNISLGYTFKNVWKQGMNFEKIRVYAQVFNAFIITGYSGSDPEVSTNTDSNVAPGIDRNTAPQARTYSFGVNLSF